MNSINVFLKSTFMWHPSILGISPKLIAVMFRFYMEARFRVKCLSAFLIKRKPADKKHIHLHSYAV